MAILQKLNKCKEICDRFQKLSEEMSDQLSNQKIEDQKDFIYKELESWSAKNEYTDKNILKTFIGCIMSTFLKSKKLYDSSSKRAFHHTNLSTFKNIIQEYQKYLGKNKISNYNKINDYVDIDSIYHHIDSPCFFCEKDYPDFNLAKLQESVRQLQKFYHWLVKYSEFIDQPNQHDFKKPAFPFAIKYFSIANFQCIKYIEEKIPVDTQFIVFLGENGDGKTSLLQALGLGLYNSDDLTDHERGLSSSIQVQYLAKNISYHNEIYNDPNYPALFTLRHKMRELKPFSAYGASRLKIVETKNLHNPLLNLNTDKAKLFNIFESWLRDISVNSPEKFDFVKNILEELLPNISKIQKKEDKPISDFIFVKKGSLVEFDHLSAGHKSIVLMIGDMIMRLSEAQPDVLNPKDLEGIVLIDELESHLHPKWQKEFPFILSTIFKKVQFIVTTHSAICLLGMPENTVFFKVRRIETEGTKIERLNIEVKNLLPNSILTSPLFALENIRSIKNEGIEKLHIEDNFDDIIESEESRNLLKLLSEKYNPKKI